MERKLDVNYVICKKEIGDFNTVAWKNLSNGL